MKKTATIILSLGLLAALLIVFVGNSNRDGQVGNEPVENSEIKDGVQYITINAKGGYTPAVSIAKAGIPSKLIVKTNGTFDCSLALVIRSIGFQKILEQTGEEVIDVGVPKAGDTISGVCSMGMYSFAVNFE